MRYEADYLYIRQLFVTRDYRRLGIVRRRTNSSTDASNMGRGWAAAGAIGVRAIAFRVKAGALSDRSGTTAVAQSGPTVAFQTEYAVVLIAVLEAEHEENACRVSGAAGRGRAAE